jgi:hypothetical protein
MKRLIILVGVVLALGMVWCEKSGLGVVHYLIGETSV